jgi:hypothetical protein
MLVPSPNVAVYTENAVLTPAALATLTAWAAAMPDSPTKTMYQNDLGNAIAAADVAVSGFDTVIVGLFHVHSDGSIYYNDFPVDSDTSAAICDSIAALKSTPGSTVKTVLISFGGGNWYLHPASVSDTDYPAMKANWATFKPALITLLQDAGADGVDWDYEPETVPFDTAFIIQITNEIASTPYLVTAAPFKDQSDWLTVIAGTVTGSSGNNFAWWGLQLYSGVPSYPNWIAALQAGTTDLTDDQIETFLLPGYSPDCGDPTHVPVNDIKGLLSNYPLLGGAFIWNYSGIQTCVTTMSAAITKIF